MCPGCSSKRLCHRPMGRLTRAAGRRAITHHRPDEQLKPASKVEAAYYKADRAIQRVLNLLAA